MDLSTNYMGMELKNPLVVSACPLSRDVDNVKRLEDAGAAAVVMFSLFEEEIRHQTLELDHFLALLDAALAYASGDESHLELLRETVETRKARVQRTERRKRLH